MKDINEFLFGPLSKNWCLYFYFLSIIWYIVFLLSILFLIRYLMGKNVKTEVAFGSLMYAFTVFVMYIEKRILHGMCINSSSSNSSNSKI